MGRKLKFVLSDLHLGAEYRQGNYLEDVTIDEKLARFLHEIRQEGERDQREIELIINGDMFEFLQVPAVDRYDPNENYPIEAYLDSSEPASIKRLNLIVEGHPEVFNALSDFMHVEAPQRRITIIKGNHDVNLYWSGVKGRLREVLGASGTRSSLLLFAEEFVNREKIYVEHGHQRTEKMNSYRDFLDPRRSDDLSQLYFPAGSYFNIDLFTRMGRERWFFDKIKPVTTLIWYALQWDFDFAASMLTQFIRYTPALVVSDFTPDKVFTLPGDGWLQDLEKPESRHELAGRYRADPDFRQEFHRQIQQYLHDATAISQGTVLSPPTEVNSDPMAIGRADQIQQRAALCRAAGEIVQEHGANVVIFGHTHCPAQETLETGQIYINTGCWLADLSNVTPEIWMDLFAGSKDYTNFRPSLPYARVDYDENNIPAGKLLDFSEESDLPASAAESQSKNKRKGFFGKGLFWFTKALSIVNG